jgi:hypothetical protein
MGDDVFIEVSEIPEHQPLVETDSCFIVVDQYGDEHIAQLDGDDWATTNQDELSPEGLDRWLERHEANHAPQGASPQI